MKLRIAGQARELPKLQKSKDLQGWKVERRPGGWMVLESPEGVRRRVMMTERQGKFSAWVHSPRGSGQWHMEILRDSHGGPGDHAGEADFTAQFPGKVRKIQVVAGDAVEKGQTLILVEAMKMEFAIKAPSKGRVTELLVTEGQQLSPGDRLLNFESEG